LNEALSCFILSLSGGKGDTQCNLALQVDRLAPTFALDRVQPIDCRLDKIAKLTSKPKLALLMQPFPFKCFERFCPSQAGENAE